MRTAEQQYQQAAVDMTGSGAQSGMAPVPLYGLPVLGQEETPLPFWRRPMFCYAVGGAAGLGLGYLVFGIVMPAMRSRKTKKNKPDESED